MVFNGYSSSTCYNQGEGEGEEKEKKMLTKEKYAKTKRFLLAVFCVLSLFLAFKSAGSYEAASKIATVRSRTEQITYYSNNKKGALNTYWRDIYYTDYCRLTSITSKDVPGLLFYNTIKTYNYSYK